MPAILCKCGVRVSYGLIPNPTEWLFISDEGFSDFAGDDDNVNADRLFHKMKNILSIGIRMI